MTNRRKYCSHPWDIYFLFSFVAEKFVKIRRIFFLRFSYGKILFIQWKRWECKEARSLLIRATETHRRKAFFVFHAHRNNSFTSVYTNLSNAYIVKSFTAESWFVFIFVLLFFVFGLVSIHFHFDCLDFIRDLVDFC